MTTKPKHGGSRPVTRPDDKRQRGKGRKPGPKPLPAGTQRVRLNVLIDPAAKAYLQKQADRESGGNIGRWLDKLAYYYGADAPEEG